MTARFAYDLNTGDLDETGQMISKFGTNPDVGTLAFEVVRARGGLPDWPTAALPLRVRAGGDVEDDAAGGDGARSVVLQGLDFGMNEITEVIPTAGVAQGAPSVLSFFRLNRAYVGEVGLYGASNVANIILEDTSGAEVAQIITDDSQTQLALFSVPVGFDAYCRRAQVTVDAQANKEATVRLRWRENADQVTGPFGAVRTRDLLPSQIGTGTSVFEAWPKFPAKTDIWWEAKGTSNATAVTITFDLLLARSPSGRQS